MRAATERAAMRRGWVWPIKPAHASPQFQRDLRQLGGLAGAGLAAQDQHLVFLQRGEDLGAAGDDGQLFGIADRGHMGAAGGHRVARGLDLSGDLRQSLVDRQSPGGALFQPVQTRAQGVRIAGQAISESGFEDLKIGGGHASGGDVVAAW